MIDVCRDNRAWLGHVYGGQGSTWCAVAPHALATSSLRTGYRRYDVPPPIRRQVNAAAVAGVDRVLEFLRSRTTARPTDPTLASLPVQVLVEGQGEPDPESAEAAPVPTDPYEAALLEYYVVRRLALYRRTQCMDGQC